MTKMWRPDRAEYLPPGEGPAEHTDRSRRAWDDRMGDLVNRHRMDRAIACGALAIAGFCAFGYYQKETHFIPPSTIVRDTAGDIVAVVRDKPGAPPDDVQVAADMKAWVKNARSIYLDSNALRNSILAAYAPLKPQSPAVNELNEFYQSPDAEPFKRAQKEVVIVSGETALPIDSMSAGHLRTFRVEWTETVQARDGRALSRHQWWAEVTYEWSPPRNQAEVAKAPDGVWITSFRWSPR